MTPFLDPVRVDGVRAAVRNALVQHFVGQHHLLSTAGAMATEFVDGPLADLIARADKAEAARDAARAERDEARDYARRAGDAVAEEIGIAAAAEVRAAALAEENKRLRAAIQNYLDGNYDQPRRHRPGQCRHGIYYYDACEQCTDEHFAAALSASAPATGNHGAEAFDAG